MSRSVLVTGASRGIGAAIAAAFAELGDRVAVHYGRSEDSAAAVLAGLPGEGHLLVQADLADASAVRRAVDEAATGLDGLDVLVNNAGVFLAHPPMSTSYDDWQARWSETLASSGIATFLFPPQPIAPAASPQRGAAMAKDNTIVFYDLTMAHGATTRDCAGEGRP